MRLGILFNDTHESLARALRAVRPDDEVISFALDQIVGDEARYQAFTALRICDHVISLDAGPEHGMLSNRALGLATDDLHILPPLEFYGFHPDTVAVKLDGVKLAGPTGLYHSRIAVAAFLANLPVDETALLFTSLAFARLGYIAALTASNAALLQHYLAYGVDISDLLPRWRAAGCFMHAPDHPKMHVMLDVARIACAKLGIAAQIPAALPPDPLAGAPQHPYFADLAQRHGHKPEGAFRAAALLDTQDFIQASYDSFRRTPRACLRAVPGIARAASLLDFPTPKRPARALMPGAMALLSWHGTIMRMERASGLLVHESVWPAAFSTDHDDSVDFTLTPEPNEDGTLTASVLPGLDLVAGALPGTIGLRRDGRFLTADAARFAVPFAAGSVGQWESFLPLSLKDVATLRSLGTRPWTCNGGAAIHPATLHLGEAFQLHLGAQDRDAPIADLRLQRPEAAGQDAETVTLRNAQGTLTLRAATPIAGAPGIPLIPVPRRVLPDRVASLAAFRTTTASSWVLEEGDEIRHPPLTVSVADAAWLAAATTGPVGVLACAATLRRMPASVMLAPGFMGMVFNAQGVLAPALPSRAVLDHELGAADAKLPRGIRRDHSILTAAANLLTEGETLHGPVLVPAGLDRTGAGFLLGPALTLALAAEALPRGTRVLLPELQPGQAAILAALGLDGFPRAVPSTQVCQVPDAIWLEQDGLETLPATLLHALRNRVLAARPKPADAPARIFLQPAGAFAPHPRLDRFLARRGIVSIAPEALTQAALRDLFLHAALIIAPSGAGAIDAPSGAGLANLIFCAQGTMVLELAPESGFDPLGWLIAEKCGLVHGVLPCPAAQGAMQVNLGRLRSLLRMLRIAADPEDSGRDQA